MSYLGRDVHTVTRNTYKFTAVLNQTTFPVLYEVGYVDVFQNGNKIFTFTATDGNNVILPSPATAGDLIEIVAYLPFNIADALTTANLATLLSITGGTLTGALAENFIDLGAGSVVDFSIAGYVGKTITGTTTFTATNVKPAPAVNVVIFELTNAGSAVINWFANTKWDDGIPPLLPATGVSLISVISRDGGVTWRNVVFSRDNK